MTIIALKIHSFTFKLNQIAHLRPNKHTCTPKHFTQHSERKKKTDSSIDEKYTQFIGTFVGYKQHERIFKFVCCYCIFLRFNLWFTGSCLNKLLFCCCRNFNLNLDMDGNSAIDQYLWKMNTHYSLLICFTSSWSMSFSCRFSFWRFSTVIWFWWKIIDESMSIRWMLNKF